MIVNNSRYIVVKTKNCDLIVSKLNKLTEHYAKEKSLVQWLYTLNLEITSCVEDPTGVPMMEIYSDIKLRLIDYEREFHDVGLYHIYMNNSFRTDPLRDVIKKYLMQYHPEYSIIESFINKFLYSFPEPLSEIDFQHLNDLYDMIKRAKIEKTNMADHVSIYK